MTLTSKARIVLDMRNVHVLVLVAIGADIPTMAGWLDVLDINSTQALPPLTDAQFNVLMRLMVLSATPMIITLPLTATTL